VSLRTADPVLSTDTARCRRFLIHPAAWNHLFCHCHLRCLRHTPQARHPQATGPLRHHRPHRSLESAGAPARCRCGDWPRSIGSPRHRVRSCFASPHTSLHTLGRAPHLRRRSLCRTHWNDLGVAQLRRIPRPHPVAPQLEYAPGFGPVYCKMESLGGLIQ
jgi:hypothetical protein